MEPKEKKNTPLDPFNVFEKTKEERDERKIERKEKKFDDEDSSKFKLDPFIEAVTMLKNKVVSLLTECDARIRDKSLAGADVAETYKKTFLNQLTRSSSLLSEAGQQRKKDKILTDEDLIKTFRDSYDDLSVDIGTSEKDFQTAKDAAIKKEQNEIKDADMKAKIGDVNVIFQEVAKMRAKLPDKVADKTKPIAPASIKIETPIKQWQQGKPANESVKKVQQLIFDKFKDNKDVSDTKLFKAFSSGTFPDGYNGVNTSALIVLLKKGFGMEDSTSDITQELIDNLDSLKESLMIEVSEKLLLFDAFIEKRKINEGFSTEKFLKAYKEYQEKTPDTTTQASDDSKGKDADKAKPEETEEDKKIDKRLKKVTISILRDVCGKKDSTLIDTFKENITTSKELDSIISLWAKLKISKDFIKMAPLVDAEDTDYDDIVELNKNTKNSISLTDAFGYYLKGETFDKLNAVLPKDSKIKFKSILKK